tara:strand:- start:7718 stop:8104 length:387 start_codon:yes stop_codon:yes gene_type:complete
MRRNKHNVSPSEQRRSLGRTFDSKAEKEYAERLQLLLDSGVIAEFNCQVPVHCLGCPENKFKPDFLVIPSPEDGRFPYYVEVKGFETPQWKTTKTLWEAYGRLELVVVKKRGKDFYEYETITPKAMKP